MIPVHGWSQVEAKVAVKFIQAFVKLFAFCLFVFVRRFHTFHTKVSKSSMLMFESNLWFVNCVWFFCNLYWFSLFHWRHRTLCGFSNNCRRTFEARFFYSLMFSQVNAFYVGWISNHFPTIKILWKFQTADWRELVMVSTIDQNLLVSTSLKINTLKTL